MATVTVGTTPVELDDGSHASVYVGNTGQVRATLTIGSRTEVFDPGFSRRIDTGGLAVMAATALGTTTLAVDTTGTAPTPGTGVDQGDLDAAVAALDADIQDRLVKTSNLSDLGNITTARTNMGLGTAATRNVGTGAGQVAAGDDSRITGAAQASDMTTALAAKAPLASPTFTGTVTVPAGSGATDAARYGQMPKYPDGTTVATTVPRAAWVDVRDHGAVGDGATDDTAALRAAYAATPTGGLLFFPPGLTFMCKADSTFAPVITASKKITFYSTSCGATLKLLAAAPNGSRMIQVSTADVLVEGLTFDTNGISSATCVYAASCSYLTVRGNRFTDPGSGALCINNAVTDCLFESNLVTGRGYGVLVNDQPGNTRLRFLNNTFRGNASGADAIEVNGSSNDHVDVSAIGNTISGYPGANPSTGFGIAFARVVGGVIAGNVVMDCGRNGIHIEALARNISVTGNFVKGCNHAGIEVQGESGKTCRNITIVGNVVEDCAKVPSVNLGRGGIELGSSTGAPFTGAGAADCIVANNLVNGCQGAGIYCFSLTNSIVQGNVIKNTYGVSSDTTNAINNTGIHMISSTNTVVCFNNLLDDQGTHTQYYPLFYYGGATGTTSFGNRTTNNLGGVTDLTTGVSKSFEAGGSLRTDGGSGRIGFYGTTPVTKPSVTGSRGGNAALDSLLTQLAALGLLTNSTSA
jgi:hypothetical protein